MGLSNYDAVELPKKPSRLRLGLLIAAIVVMLMVMGAANLFQSDEGQRLLGTGTVIGMVVDENDKPVEAEIYVLRTDIAGRTDASGAFLVSGVPAGTRLVVVAQNGGGIEYPVVVRTGDTTDMGKLKFMGTRVPSQ